jgi:hypothetical protein
MKRNLSLTILILLGLIAYPVYARMTVGIVGGSVPSGGASYTLGWNGEHASGTDYYSDGTQADDNNATIDGSYAHAGSYGMQLDSNDEDLTKTSYNIATTGTLWFWVNVRQPSTTRDVLNPMIEWDGDPQNIVRISVNDASDTMYANWKAETGSVNEVIFSTQTFSEDTWTLVGFAWDMGNDLYSFVVGSSTWSTGDEDTSLELGAFGSTPNVFSLGENLAGPSGISSNVETWLDDVYYINSYKAAYPGS